MTAQDSNAPKSQCLASGGVAGASCIETHLPRGRWCRVCNIGLPYCEWCQVTTRYNAGSCRCWELACEPVQDSNEPIVFTISPASKLKRWKTWSCLKCLGVWTFEKPAVSVVCPSCTTGLDVYPVVRGPEVAP